MRVMQLYLNLFESKNACVEESVQRYTNCFGEPNKLKPDFSLASMSGQLRELRRFHS
jgi:hypothetical protein